jgi:hypothetical protein
VGWKVIRKPSGEIIYKRKTSLILRTRNITVLPGHDERQLLSEKRYMEALIVTSTQMRHLLDNLYFRLCCADNTYTAYFGVRWFSYEEIITACSRARIISKKDIPKIERLWSARHELLHSDLIHPRYIDGGKVEKVILPCMPIIDKLHRKMVLRLKRAKKKG